MAERVVLHIGAMKSGTTYIQDRLNANAEALARHGILVPRRQVLAVLDALGAGQVGNEGSWRELVQQAEAFDGTVVVSMEFLGPAKPENIRKVLSSFSGSDVDVVMTVRDLNRNIPAMWQETVQNYRTWTWESHVSQVRRPVRGPGAGPGKNFWRQQDFGKIARSWIDLVGRDRFTIVTLPPPGAGPEILWERFCEAVGMDPAWAAPVPRSNEALGAASALVLRRVNEALSERELPWKVYSQLVKFGVAKRGLASRKSQESAIGFVAPRWIKRRSRALVQELAQLQVRVIGDLADLEPIDVPGVDPGTVSLEEQLDAAVAAVAETVVLWAEDRARRSRRPAEGGPASPAEGEHRDA